MLKRRVGVWCGTLVVAFAIACRQVDDSPWHTEPGYRWHDLSIAAGDAGFTHMEGRGSGFDFQNAASDTLLVGNRILAQGAGVALGDVDGDGKVDVFMARTEGCSALYRNLGDWKFEDITKSAGVGACGRNSTGAVFADVDGNGTLDLILLSTRGPNSIFLNDGKGHFTEHRDLGLDVNGKGGTTITLADVDGDGKLDMYVANYRMFNIDDSIPPQRRQFNQIVRQTGPNKYEVVPEFRNEYKLVMRPDMGGMRMTVRGARDEFYSNVGGRFVHVPFGQKFSDADGKPAVEDESFGLDAKFADLNGDGIPDLYVGNDFEDLDQLWINDGHGNFRLADWRSLRQMSNSSMGIGVGDVNGDGLPDLFVDDMLANDSRRLRTQIPTHTALPKRPGDIETQLQQQRNVLFLNRGDGTFAEIAQMAGVGASGWSWGALFMDVDLDGHEDILVANGHLWDIMDADVQEGLQNRLTEVDWRKVRWQFPKLALKNVAYRNRGDLTFEDASEKWRWGMADDISHTLATADLDGDGDLDVVVNKIGAPAALLRNDASAPRIAVRLIGDAPNTQAVGSRIRLTNGAVPLQQHEVTAGGIYMSHSDYLQSFAMGASKNATLVVDWRDGRRTTIANVQPNRLYEINASTAMQPARTDSVKSRPLFEDATVQLGGHTHTENVFDEWDKQILTPVALSTGGPGVAWFDLDGDGYEDLLIGSGKGGRLGVFHNEHGHLVYKPALGPVAHADFTAILGFRDTHGSHVLAGVSTWEMRSEAEMIAQPAAVGIAVAGSSVASTATGIVGSHDGATGPMALGDYDGDGALDLFVGSRAIPMKYPLPASSALFRNVGGKFVIDTVNSAVLHDVGMVSSAIFSDVNGDGYPDLVLAREWDSILILLNDGKGRFTRAPASWGLDKLTSQWIGVAAGDLDGDGRMDLVATSWGRNTQMHPTVAHPVQMMFGEFGSNHTIEPLLTQDDARVHATTPLSSYARVRAAIPDVVTRVGTFAAYADASANQILGPWASTARQLSIVTLDNTVFMNRGDHFEAFAMPVEAQFAPASYAGVADFDGDGNEDVFLGQNILSTPVGTPRYDNGRGLLLLGNGKGALLPLTGAHSGIIVYGEQRGAAFADYDRDGRIDLVVSQNGNKSKLFHNISAKPGLRVRLAGAASNPDGIGAQIRLVYGDRMGPAREVSAGSGYWSQNGAVQVMGMMAHPTQVWVRWPGNAETRVPVKPGATEVVVTQQLR